MNCPRCSGKVDMIGTGDTFGPGDVRPPVYRCYENKCRWSGSIDTPEAWQESGASTSASRANASAIAAKVPR
jgi:hypothetical protein